MSQTTGVGAATGAHDHRLLRSAVLCARLAGETGAPFSLLVDDDRHVYHSYGLEASFWRNWGRRPTGDSSQEDLHQLGGDFIIDAQGTVRFAYPSLDPVDRPSVDELLAVIDQLPPLS